MMLLKKVAHQGVTETVLHQDHTQHAGVWDSGLPPNHPEQLTVGEQIQVTLRHLLWTSLVQNHFPSHSLTPAAWLFSPVFPE
jgi:hypothetical protein